MKLVANISVIKPSKDHLPLIEQAGIQEIVMEDVASFEFSENGIKVNFNQGNSEVIPLRGNNGQDGTDWRFASLQVTRKFLNVDFAK